VFPVTALMFLVFDRLYRQRKFPAAGGAVALS
jgi:hypothetical protein